MTADVSKITKNVRRDLTFIFTELSEIVSTFLRISLIHVKNKFNFKEGESISPWIQKNLKLEMRTLKTGNVSNQPIFLEKKMIVYLRNLTQYNQLKTFLFNFNFICNTTGVGSIALFRQTTIEIQAKKC